MFRTPAVLLVLQLTQLGVPALASAFCRLMVGSQVAAPGCDGTSTGIPLAWQRRCMSYSVSEPKGGLTFSQARTVIEASFQSWQDVTCDGGHKTGIEIVEFPSPPQPVACREPEHNVDGLNANAILFVDDWSRRGNGSNAFGLTFVWHNTTNGEIVDADMELNDARQDRLAVCPDTGCPSGTVDLQNVVTHEAGHFLGLGHSQFSRATMAFQATGGEITKRTLADDDRLGLCTIYKPGTLPAECDFMPVNGWAAECGVPLAGGCGCSLPGSRIPLRLPWTALALGLAAVFIARTRRQRRRVKMALQDRS
ncbi:MAG: matrixin family metalloprotease [Proteobacteria bacterium]|nr:matrixin family metalloprotease [Pseudomonadota bacterium]